MSYTDEELLKEINRLTDELGHPPTITEFRKYGEYSVTTYYSRFGSWKEAIKEAGYEPRQPESKIPEEDLLNELQTLAEELGEPPSAAQMNENGKYWASTYRDRFGSWNEAVEMADLEPTAESTKIATAELLAEIQRLTDTLGEPPTFQEMEKQGEYTANVYVSRFGSWNEAIEAAGFEPTTKGSSLTDTELLKELQRLADELGKQPSSREMDEHGRYGTATYQRHFGSWSNALEMAFDGKTERASSHR